MGESVMASDVIESCWLVRICKCLLGMMVNVDFVIIRYGFVAGDG